MLLLHGQADVDEQQVLKLGVQDGLLFLRGKQQVFKPVLQDVRLLLRGQKFSTANLQQVLKLGFYVNLSSFTPLLRRSTTHAHIHSFNEQQVSMASFSGQHLVSPAAFATAFARQPSIQDLQSSLNKSASSRGCSILHDVHQPCPRLLACAFGLAAAGEFKTSSAH